MAIQAGTQVNGIFQFNDPTTGGFTQGNIVAVTDLGGGFVSDNPLPELVPGSPGTLVVQVWSSFPALPAGGIVSASWDGTKFTITK